MPLRERLPVIGVPLRAPDPDQPLDLQAALATAIERGSYDLDMDYDKPPPVPLAPEDAAWARELLDARPK